MNITQMQLAGNGFLKLSLMGWNVHIFCLRVWDKNHKAGRHGGGVYTIYLCSSARVISNIKCIYKCQIIQGDILFKSLKYGILVIFNGIYIL